jgi:aryl-alcohol dehydrogenase-like predicted oxidoreductase
MRYRELGNTGLIVSSVGLVTMQFGGKMNMGNLGQEETTRMVKLALARLTGWAATGAGIRSACPRHRR